MRISDQATATPFGRFESLKVFIKQSKRKRKKKGILKRNRNKMGILILTYK